MKKKILEVKGLVKEFKGIRAKLPYRAVDNVSFSLEEGEILGIVGESGSGKSTLSLLILKLLPKTHGTIKLFGKDIYSLNAEEEKAFRKNAQIIFQDPFSSLNPKKTIFEILFEGMKFHNLVEEKEDARPKIEELLLEVGLPKDTLFRFPHAFSGGQRQRIAIARALSINPQFLICDEILSALDLSIQAQVLGLLYELKKKRSLSLLFISHDLSTVERFVDRCLVFYRGKIVENGPVSELFSAPSHPYTELLLSSIPRSDPREEKKELRPLEILRERRRLGGCPFYERCPKALPECEVTFPEEKNKTKGHAYHCIY